MLVHCDDALQLHTDTEVDVTANRSFSTSMLGLNRSGDPSFLSLSPLGFRGDRCVTYQQHHHHNSVGLKSQDFISGLSWTLNLCFVSVTRCYT